MASEIVELVAERDAMRKALRATREALLMVYDSSEDNRNNPIMQKIGQAMTQARAAMDKSDG